MQPNTTALERAFELARCEICTTISEIKQRLTAEGYWTDTIEERYCPTAESADRDGARDALFDLYTVLFGVVCVLLETFIIYARYAAVLKWATLSLFAYVGVVFAAHVPWRSAIYGTPFRISFLTLRTLWPWSPFLA